RRDRRRGDRRRQFVWRQGDGHRGNAWRAVCKRSRQRNAASRPVPVVGLRNQRRRHSAGGGNRRDPPYADGSRLAMPELLLKISGLNKSFFGVQVLRDVGFELAQGAVLGLVGENGSGKSTTMNILGGVLTRDSGRIELAGEDVAPSNSRDALALGIAFIHQELSLFPNLSVEENIFLDHFPRRMHGLPFIDRRTLREQAKKALDLVDLKVSPATPVMRLPQGERQLVEIAKALTRQARLI